MSEKLITKVNWEINNYCTGGCSYCPNKFWGGPKPRIFTEYIDAAKIIISHYTDLGRYIDWRFTGGEPLEFFDFPALLKLCKENNGNIDLTTNGGKIWLDWWAVEPHVDRLNLTYHYWQNPKLIKFIIETFLKNNKVINVTIPIRPDYFDDDIERVYLIEKEYQISVNKQTLFKEASQMIGMFPYTESQLEILYGIDWVKNNIRNKPELTFEEKNIQLVQSNPVFTGQLCNIGIEVLNISSEGWISGSSCNNTPLGNIWENYTLPKEPSVCKMKACTNGEDQLITKF